MGIQRFGFYLIGSLMIATAFGQNALSADPLSATYYTKIVIPTSARGCKIQISRNDISPGVDSCRYFGHLETGSLVRLNGEKKDGRWMKLDLSTEEDQQFTIYVERESGSYKDIFGMLLSDEPYLSTNKGCDSVSKGDLIWNIGFPSFFARDKASEVWEFPVEHPASYSGNICGYDTAIIRITNDGAVEIGGSV